jgi:hypothetical protein
LVAIGEERPAARGPELGVWSGGQFFVLGALDHAGAP